MDARKRQEIEGQTALFKVATEREFRSDPLLVHEEVVFEPNPELPSAPLPPSDDTPETNPFAERNSVLEKIIKPGGYLSLVSKRRGAVKVQRRHGGAWTPPGLRKYAEQKESSYPGYAKTVEANYDDLQTSAQAAISKACGMCALRSQCEFGDRPQLFQDKFGVYKARQKLIKALLRDPATKCDDI